jgi:hypothetical protein
MDHMRRPKATVLPDAALVPDRNLIQPPPTQFTHEIIAEQPYYYTGPHQAAPPEGKFPAGTKVKLIAHDGGPVCQVADDRGLCVVTAFSGLQPLPS